MTVKRVVLCTNAHTRHLLPGSSVDNQYVTVINKDAVVKSDTDNLV